MPSRHDPLYHPEPYVREVYVRWLMGEFQPVPRPWQHRPLALTDLTYTHPGALRHGARGAIVTGLACRSCGSWVDRPARGRLPRFCSHRCRTRAWRAAA